MRGTSLIISRCLIPVQLEQKRPCEGLRREHAIFDRCPCSAAFRCGDDDTTVPRDIVARYGFAIHILKADFFTHRGDPFWGRFISSGSLAIFTAIRLASSRVSKPAAVRRPGSSSKYTKASACPLWSRTMKHGWVSSTVHGGGKRRELGITA
jgi:hypothetical protein